MEEGSGGGERRNGLVKGEMEGEEGARMGEEKKEKEKGVGKCEVTDTSTQCKNGTSADVKLIMGFKGRCFDDERDEK